jgi:ABC-type branched-subunit amino acid transport system substrate-binding protein
MTLSRRTSDRGCDRIALAVLAALGAFPAESCGGGSESAATPIGVGLLLSFTGPLAAISNNSERALRMAIDAGNAAGGVSSHPLRVISRDTGSDPSKVLAPATELANAGVAVVVGPDTDDLVIAARRVLADRTVILPSFATSGAINYKPASWFVIGVPAGRVICELAAQTAADHRTSPLVIYEPTGYSTGIAWTLTNQYGFTKTILPTTAVPSPEETASVTGASADSYVLAAVPTSAVSLIYALLAQGRLTDPTLWYLSPSLHNPVFLQLIPQGSMTGAHGVSQGTTPDGPPFRDAFVARWHEEPLDDAYPFYDAGALTALSLQRALARQGAVPTGLGLSEHLIAVTRPGGTPIHWNELGRGLEVLRQGQEVTYQGLSGQLEFNALGATPGASTQWWVIGPDGFENRPAMSDCVGAQ